MNEDLLHKWLNNELNDTERQAFEKSDAFAAYGKIAKEASALRGAELDAHTAFAAIKAKRNTTNPGKVVRMPALGTLLKIAAVLVVALGTFFYLNNGDDTYSTDLAETLEVRLPDTSEVRLNAGSELAYDAKNWANVRELKLSGEAYFKVAKGKKFTVHTQAGAVSVLGTQFNVRERNGHFEVVCYEGLVQVDHKGEQIKLSAGQGFRALVGDASVALTPTESAPSWIRKESSFDGWPLAQVLAELERQYDISVSTENVETQARFSGSFTHTNLELALKSIAAPFNLTYTQSQGKVRLYAQNTP
jgi:ferric-dicitrate binding protein FerR (iron transport regulator)